MSKQRALQAHDQSSCQKTASGKKPLLNEYLVFMHVAIMPTTYESHGHKLGYCLYVIRSYCAACKAGCGLCTHFTGCLYMQYLHWGKGRPTPMPPTAKFCSWIPGMRPKREVSMIKPASNTHIEKLPRSEAEAQLKNERGDLRQIWKRVHRYVSHDRLTNLFECLRAAGREKAREEYKRKQKMKQ